VKRLVQPSTAPLSDLILDTYKVIEEYNRTDKSVIPKSSAMLEILQKMGFHQIHFYCHKKSVGRVVSIMTKNDTAGQQVVRYFTDDAFASSKAFPAACGSFDRLPEDTSFLGQKCSKWGRDSSGSTDVGKWGGKDFYGPVRIVGRPFQIVSSPTYGFAYQKIPSNDYRLCDDALFAPEPSQAGDKWQISVR
jgi:hypothetical protein